MKPYYLLDLLFDPPPKELRKKRDKTGIMLYYQAQDEGYRRYKHLCYRNLILEALLAFCLGICASCLFDML